MKKRKDFWPYIPECQTREEWRKLIKEKGERSNQISYQEYLQTDHWKIVKKRAIKRAGYRCQLCGKADIPLEVHHNKYDNLWAENLKDLIALCKECHERYHANIPEGE